MSDRGASVGVVEAVAWTAIALLATTSVGSFVYLGTRIDSLGGRIDAQGADLGRRIDAVSADLGRRIDAVSADLGGRIDAMTARIDSHLERHAG